MATAYEPMILDDQMHPARYGQEAAFSFTLIYTFDPIEMGMDEIEFLQS